jgi:hypothetical protein
MTPKHAADMPHGANKRGFAKCSECGQQFVQSRTAQRFCPAPGARVSPCAKAWANRNTKRGGPTVPILMAWAATRHAKAGTREADINRYARRELTAMAREYAEQDKGAGRPTPLDYVGALMDSASLFVDRKR